jgi:hypothetical protein
MSEFVKNLIRTRLSEANITTHALERAEERVWGNSSLSYNGTNPDPPTINKDAWANSDKYPKIDVQTAKSGIETIPATNPVIDIMRKIKFVKNLNVTVNLGENEIIFLVLYKSKDIQRGGNIWGNNLVGSCFPTANGGNVVTLEWKNTTDLTQFKKGVSTPKYVVDVSDLIRKNITTLDDTNISELSIYGKNKNIEQPKKDKYKKISLINGEEVRYYEDSNRFETLDGAQIPTDDIFDRLKPEWQKVVFNKLNEVLNP